MFLKKILGKFLTTASKEKSFKAGFYRLRVAVRINSSCTFNTTVSSSDDVIFMWQMSFRSFKPASTDKTLPSSICTAFSNLFKFFSILKLGNTKSTLNIYSYSYSNTIITYIFYSFISNVNFPKQSRNFDKFQSDNTFITIDTINTTTIIYLSFISSPTQLC